MLIHGDVDFLSTDEVKVLIIAGSVSDARAVKHVLLAVSTLRMLLHSNKSNLRCISEGRSSVAASPRELIPINRGSQYSTSWLEEGLYSLKV
jgi:hypothetical protein